MTPDFFSGAGMFPADMVITVLVTLSAILTYARIGFEHKTLKFMGPRMVLGVGWTLLATRYWSAFWLGADIPLSPMSIIAVGMITGAYCTIQLMAIKRAIILDRNPINCLQVPTEPCYREDRIKELMDRQ